MLPPGALPRPVRLLLDTSAVLAYTDPDRAIHVGETIAEVALDGRAFGVSVLAIAEALATGADPDMVQLLTQHVAFISVAVPIGLCRPLAVALALVDGRASAAEALTLAIEMDCDVLTAEAGLYAALGDDAPIIGI